MWRRRGRRTALATVLGLVTLSVSVTVVASQRPHEPAGPTTTIVSRDGVELVITRTGKHGRPAPVPVGSSATDAPTDSRARSAPATSSASSTISDDARFDLDGDGLDEIVSQVTANSPEIGYRRVVIDYSLLPVRDFVGSSVTPQPHGLFGSAMTTGDFDGDGYKDLVIGDAGEFVSGQPGGLNDVAGAVWVFHGTAEGIDPDTPQHLNQDTPGVPDEMVGFEQFGNSVAAGDLNADGFDDLAVGTPYELAGEQNARVGAVFLFFGGASGLNTTGVQMLTQDSPGSNEIAELRDGFGYQVAIGDVTGDGVADLAVGAPGEGSEFRQEHGAVSVYPGSPEGLGAASVVGGPIGGGPEIRPSTIGEVLKLADVNGDGFDDIITGTPRLGPGGGVTYLPGTAQGVTSVGHRTFTQGADNVPGVIGPLDWPTRGNESFGYSLATGDVTGDGIDDVLVGTPDDLVGGVPYAGSVTLLLGSVDGLTGNGALGFTSRPPGDPMPEPRIGVGNDIAEERDSLGASVAILNLDGTGPLDMIAGVPGEWVSGNVGDFANGQLVQLAIANRPAIPSPATRTREPQPIAALMPVTADPALEMSPGGSAAGMMAEPSATDDGRVRPPGAGEPSPTEDGRVRPPDLVLTEVQSWTGLAWSFPPWTLAGLGTHLLTC